MNEEMPDNSPVIKVELPEQLQPPKKIYKRRKLSEIGKLKCSMNKVKHVNQLNQNGPSPMTRVMKKYGLDSKVPERKLEQMKVFKFLLNQFKASDLNEIEALFEVVAVLQSDLAKRTIEKAAMDMQLDDEDMKLMKLLKDTLETSHRLKHGVKHSHLHADLKDIRQMMLEN